MKAVYLLVCLALARDSAGSVFKRQRYMPSGVVVQPLDEIEQYQFQQRQNSKQAQRLSQQRGITQYKQQDQDPSSAEKRYQKYRQQDSSSEQEPYKTQSRQQEYNQQAEQYQYKHQEQPSVQYPYRPQEYPYRPQEYSSEQGPYQPQQYKQQGRVWSSAEQSYEPQQYQQQYHDSTEQQDQPATNKISKYTAPMYADKVQRAYPLVQATRSNKQMKKPVFGESIEWRGVKIASTPSTPVNKEDIQLIFNQAYETMNHVGSEEMKTFHESLEAAIQNSYEDTYLNATELLRKNQYQVEEHIIKTEDGYYLTLFRIAPKEPTLVQKPVVFLMHGLLGSADDWLLMGPGKSLAYLLADAGYEVWLGNSRGSKYSRHHVSKHPALADFWQFSTDDIALFDLPAMIDYALNVSKQEKLYYVGYSQGTTDFFALASTRPEYNDKIIMMYALSPMAYMSNVRSPMLRMIAPNSPLYENLRQQLGHGMFMPSMELVKTVGGAMCLNEIGCKNVCSNVNFVMSGMNVESLDVELIPRILRRLPAGTSTRQIKQFAQWVASQQFTKYDYGAYMNEKIYGSPQPPKYDMSKVKAPVALYYSEEDWLAHPRDVKRLEKELINVKDSYMIPVEHFSNLDFQFSKSAPEAVYKRLIESIKSQDNKQTYL